MLPKAVRTDGTPISLALARVVTEIGSAEPTQIELDGSRRDEAARLVREKPIAGVRHRKSCRIELGNDMSDRTGNASVRA